MLYKYCTADGFDILLQSRLKAARIEDFNDPFELVFGVDQDTALENIKREFEENPELTRAWLRLLDDQKIQYDKSSPEDIVGTDLGDVDENNDFPSLCNCGRRFLCLGKRD